MSNIHKVAIVFDKHFKESLHLLAISCHVWLVESPSNLCEAEKYWNKEGRIYNLRKGISTFQASSSSISKALDDVMELVDEHHGEFASPSISQILLIGIGLTSKVKYIIHDWGYCLGEQQVLGRLIHKNKECRPISE